LIDNTDKNDDNENNKSNDYGYFCELDTMDKILIEKIPLDNERQRNIIHNYINKYYVYNYYNQKKDDDVEVMDDKENDKENNRENENNNEKYNDLYFLIHLIFITSTGFVLIYLTIN
jgi:hypothetical protein